MSPEEIRAAAEVHRELGPEYSDAVVESFFEKVDSEIGARIDARLASMPQSRRPVADSAKLAKRRTLLTGVAIGTAVTGIPLTWFAIVVRGSHAASQDYMQWLLGIWIVIATIYVVCASRLRRPPGRR